MKKTIILAIALITALYAAATDRFYIEDFSIAAGKTCIVSILLDNETAYTAFQSDVYLPDGLTASNFTLTARKNSNHSLTATVLPDGGIRLLSYSVKLKTYSGNSGALVTFDVTASEEFVGPTTIMLRHTLFTTEDGVEIPFNDETCSVTAVKLGDVNDDGFINVADVTALIQIVLNSTPVDLAVADINGDNQINVADVTALIQMVLNN